VKRLQPITLVAAVAFIVAAPFQVSAQAASPAPAPAASAMPPVILNGCSIVSNIVRVPDASSGYSDNTFTIQYTILSPKPVKTVDATGSAGKGIDRSFTDGQPFPARGTVTHTFKFDGLVPITSVACKIDKVTFADGTTYTPA
jgi:hypothetical protein